MHTEKMNSIIANIKKLLDLHNNGGMFETRESNPGACGDPGCCGTSEEVMDLSYAAEEILATLDTLTLGEGKTE